MKRRPECPLLVLVVGVMPLYYVCSRILAHVRDQPRRRNTGGQARGRTYVAAQARFGSALPSEAAPLTRPCETSIPTRLMSSDEEIIRHCIGVYTDDQLRPSECDDRNGRAAVAATADRAAPGFAPDRGDTMFKYRRCGSAEPTLGTFRRGRSPRNAPCATMFSIERRSRT